MNGRSNTLLSLLRRLACALLVAGALAPLAAAQNFPSRPMRMIAPFPAGSATDMVARLMARNMGEILGQPIAVENRAGANGIGGVEHVKQAAGDPHVLLLAAATTHAANPYLYRKLPYDPVKDFTPLAKIGLTAFVLMVRNEFPARTMQEFLAHARANNGKLSYAHGSAGMLASSALLTKLGRFDAQPIAYKGNPPALADLLAGVIDFSFVDLGNAVAQLKGGKLKALGVTMARRTVLVPDLPTVAEAANMPGFEVVPWVGLLAPAGIPRAARDALNAAAATVVNRADFKAQLVSIGLDPDPQDGDGFGRTIEADIKVWARLLADAGIKPE